jgi:hypothetical protein
MNATGGDLLFLSHGHLRDVARSPALRGTQVAEAAQQVPDAAYANIGIALVGCTCAFAWKERPRAQLRGERFATRTR